MLGKTPTILRCALADAAGMLGRWNWGKTTTMLRCDFAVVFGVPAGQRTLGETSLCCVAPVLP
eukprot:13584046-Alexandrium_andersonii.AAC.1